MRPLANPLKRVHGKSKLRRCIDNVFDIACVDQSRQMKNGRGTQPRPEVGRICRQIPHRLIKREIQPRLGVVVHTRCHLKGLREGEPRCHGLYMQMIVLID